MTRKLYPVLVLFFVSVLPAGSVFAQKTWYETDQKVLSKLSALVSAESEVAKNANSVDCSAVNVRNAKLTGTCEMDKEYIQALLSLTMKTLKTIESEKKITTTKAFFLYSNSLNMQTAALHLVAVSVTNPANTAHPLYVAVKGCEAPTGGFMKMTMDMIEEDDRLLFESQHGKKALIQVD